MRRQYLPTGFYVGQTVLARYGKAIYRGQVAISDSTTHVFLPNIGNFPKEDVAAARRHRKLHMLNPCMTLPSSCWATTPTKRGK